MKDDLSLDSITSAFLNEEQSRARRNQEESDSSALSMDTTLMPLGYFCDLPSHVVCDCAEMKAAASALARQKTAGLPGSSGNGGNGNGKRGGRGRG